MFLLQAGSSIRFCNGAGRDDTYRPAYAAPAGLTTVWSRNGFFQEIVSTNSDYTMVTSDQKKLRFLPLDGTPAAGRISSIEDRNGNTIRFSYDGLGRLQKIADTLDRDILVSYNPDGFIEAVTDFSGRSVRYTYFGQNEPRGSVGDLKSVTTPVVIGTPNGNDFPSGKTTTYSYTKGFADQRLSHNLLTITDGRGSNYLVNIYSTTTDPDDITFDRVVRQMRGGDIIDLTYVRQTASPANNNAIIKIILNDRVGNVSEHFYDVGNRLVLLREYTGRADPTQPTTDGTNRPVNRLRTSDPPYFETRTTYNADFKPTRIVHPNGNITEMVYEGDLTNNVPVRSRGNLRLVRRLSGTHTPVGDQPALIEQFEYDAGFGCSACGFNFVTKHVDVRGHVILMQYDERGNLLARTNRISSIIENFTWNSRGQMSSRTLPDNGSGHRRVDVYNYHTTGTQRGYLSEEIIDSGGFNLTTHYEYDLFGNVVRRIAPRGQDTLYAINALDQVVRETSPEVLPASGVRYIKDYFYDANNNVVRVEVQNRSALEDGGAIDAANPTWTTTYDYEILNRLIRKSEEVEPGRFIVTEYGYDGNRNRTVTRFGEATAGRQPNNVVQMLYDERDLPFREIRGAGGADQSTTQFDYDPNGNRVRVAHGLEDPDGAHVTSSTYDGYNRLFSMTDLMGNVTSHHYDASGNRTNTLVMGELDDQPGSTANVRLSEAFWRYDEMNRPVRQDVAFFNATNQAPIGDGLATTRTTYSDNSQVLAVINDNNHGTTNRYDTANRLGVITDAKGNTIAYSYDSDSNVRGLMEAEKSDLDGHVENFTTTFAYDNLNRLASTTDNIGNLNRSGYDSRNNRTVTVDALTNKVLYAYDGLKRLTQTTRLMTQDGAGMTPVTGQIVTRQTWDDTSRLTRQIDANANATTYLYDGLNRKFAIVYADFTGQTNAFDVHHNAVRFTDANGNIVTNRYDLLNRVTNRLVTVGPAVAATTTFERFQYDGLSRLASASNDVSLVTRSYNSLGDVTHEVQSLTNSAPAVVDSVYDGIGNLTQLKYPGGRIVTTTYDGLERKQNISDTNGMIATYYFIGPQRVTRRDYGNGTRCDYSYDGITGVSNAVSDFGVKRMTHTRHFRVADTNIIDDRTYTWDRTGNKTENKDVRAGSPQWQRNYAYDSVHRLIHSMKSSSTGSTENITYDLDGVGNRLSVIGVANSGPYTMDATIPEPADKQLNQYTSNPSGARLNDKNGNLSIINVGQSSQRIITYDFGDRMATYTNAVSGVVATYAYDAIGRRIEKRIVFPSPQTTRFVNHEWQEIGELDELDVVRVTYAFGRFIDEVLDMRREASISYFHGDSLHSPMAVSDLAGTVSERYEYSDFGQPEFLTPTRIGVPESAIQNSWLFTGRRYDAETEFCEFRTRYYQPDTRRFSSRDTLGVWIDIINSGNSFTYCGNNPTSLLDPMGMQSTGSCSELWDEERKWPARWPDGKPLTWDDLQKIAEECENSWWCQNIGAVPGGAQSWVLDPLGIQGENIWVDNANGGGYMDVDYYLQHRLSPNSSYSEFAEKYPQQWWQKYWSSKRGPGNLEANRRGTELGQQERRRKDEQKKRDAIRHLNDFVGRPTIIVFPL